MKRIAAVILPTTLVAESALAAPTVAMADLTGVVVSLALVVGFMSQTYGFEISFVQWMMVGIPMMLVILPITHVVLTKFAFPLRLETLPGGREYIESELVRLGGMSRAEKMVAVVFALTATLALGVAEQHPFAAAPHVVEHGERAHQRPSPAI